MKRKRGETIGYQKDELLLETTSLNLKYNITFQLETNTHIYQYAKDKDVEIIYKLNEIIRRAISDEHYIDMEAIKRICAL